MEHCQYCQRTFTSEARLKQHMTTGACVTKCHRCNKNFCRSQSLKNHLEKNVCQKTSKIIACAFCKKEFPCPQRLKRHKEKCLGHFCGDKEWHERRCTEEYDLSDIECFDCGDLIFRCPCKEAFIRELILEKKAIDDRFPGADFDKVEGVPWENADYWMSEDKAGCGAVRKSEEHISRCLYPIKDRQPKEEKIIVKDGDYEAWRFNSCEYCEKVFSTYQRLPYHLDHNVCRPHLNKGYECYLRPNEEE